MRKVFNWKKWTLPVKMKSLRWSPVESKSYYELLWVLEVSMFVIWKTFAVSLKKWLAHFYCRKTFKPKNDNIFYIIDQINVSRLPLQSLHEKSLKITHTVPLKCHCWHDATFKSRDFFKFLTLKVWWHTDVTNESSKFYENFQFMIFS